MVLNRTFLLREREIEVPLPTPEKVLWYVGEFSRRTGCQFTVGVPAVKPRVPSLMCGHMNIPVTRAHRWVMEPGKPLTANTESGLAAGTAMTLEGMHNKALEHGRRAR